MGYREPIELNGPYTGYNNGPTMQVGLWITNDGAEIEKARAVAREGGPDGLQDHLSHRIRNWHTADNADLVRGVDYRLSDRDLDEVIDWAQVAYALLFSREDEQSRAAVARLVAEREAEAQS